MLEAPKIIGLALLQHVIKVTYNRVVNNYTRRKNFIYNLEKQNKSIGINLLKHTLIMLKHNNFDHFNDLHKYELYWIYRYLSILLFGMERTGASINWFCTLLWIKGCFEIIKLSLFCLYTCNKLGYPLTFHVELKSYIND